MATLTVKWFASERPLRGQRLLTSKHASIVGTMPMVLYYLEVAAPAVCPVVIPCVEMQPYVPVTQSAGSALMSPTSLSQRDQQWGLACGARCKQGGLMAGGLKGRRSGRQSPLQCPCLMRSQSTCPRHRHVATGLQHSLLPLLQMAQEPTRRLCHSSSDWSASAPDLQKERSL
jgi:hypothetical protein